MTKSKNFHNLWEFARASRVLMATLIFMFTTLAAFGALSAHQRPAQAASEQDCSSNSIIKCGVSSPEDFIKKYKANTTGDLDDIYQLSGTELTQIKTAVHGTVYKDGRVVVNGKVVATGAKSMGRQYLAGSTAWKAPNGKTYYIRPTSVSFEQNSLDALVVVDKDGKALAAFLTACGNPLAFTPVTPPKKTTPPPLSLIHI